MEGGGWKVTKPATADEYRRDGNVEAVRATCLYVATKLGNLMDDLIVVGGLVPALLIDQGAQSPNEAHPGTMDLDIGLTLGLLKDGRYRALGEALRGAGFAPDVSEQGNLTRQRWRTEGLERVTVDFLIPADGPDDRGGKIQNIEPDFAAIITPGLHLAFQDRYQVKLSGVTIRGERATRDVWVCGPGAYVVLKALAFDDRGENKDAFDLYYMLRHYGSGVEDVVARSRPLLGDASARKALDVLRRDFCNNDDVGPCRVAQFHGGGADAEIQADVAGFVSLFLRLMDG